ncbi:MAG: trypsin-like peptidase domain-containing protein [Chloroflexota bacterium]|nr:trypsin-like peptidase domain-containing protein [Chloroflexota bacterium]MDE2918330.1 trypsin-like peptidase domain-containing protein [Chloroflexota bacterium]
MSRSSPPQQSTGVSRWVVGLLALTVVLGTGGGAISGYVAGRVAAPPAPQAAPPAAPAAAPVVAGSPTSYAGLLETLMPAVVTVEVRRGALNRGSGIGTGFFYNADGRILTNAHVLPEEESGDVRITLSDGQRIPAKVLGRDVWGDVAVLQAEGGPFPALELADNADLRVGEPVLAIGSPRNFRNTATSGIVSGLDRLIPRTVNTDSGPMAIPLRGLIQTDAAVNQGNSGGPLVTADGRVIGINTAVQSNANDIGFALPIADIIRRLPELESTGTVARGLLGVRYQLIDPELDSFAGTPYPYAVAVSAVMPDTTAQAAGVRPADVIVAVNGQALTRDFNLSHAIDGAPVGETITLSVRRMGQPLDLQATLTPRPRATSTTPRDLPPS